MRGDRGFLARLHWFLYRTKQYVIFLISKIVAVVFWRRDRVWLFSSFATDPQFSNNAKYLYLHVAHNHPDVRPIWITGSPEVYETLSEAGHEVEMRRSLRARYLALRAGSVILDSSLEAVPIEYAGGAVKVQLTHGIPIKGPRRWKDRASPGARSDRGTLHRLAEALARRVYSVDYFCVPSEEAALQFARWVRASSYQGHMERSFPSSRVLLSGFPRTDVFYRPVPGADLGNPPEVQEKLGDLEAFDVVIGYLPTFREGRTSIAPFDGRELSDFLEDRDGVLVVKSHHAMPVSVPSDSDRIRVLPSRSDSSTFLQQIDILVTDYSSIYFDYLHTGNPVLLYTFDREDYEESRGLLSNFDEVTAAAQHVQDFRTLLSTLDNLCDGDLADPRAEEARRLRERFFIHRDGNAAERIVAALTGAGKGAEPPSLSADEVMASL